MVMLRTTAFLGNTTIRQEDPALHTANDILYIPGVWGLYDRARHLVHASAYLRGPAPDLIGSQYTAAPAYDAVSEEAPDDLYYYLGPIHNHFGHFLVASLARMWAYDRARHGSIKIVTFVNPIDNVISHFPFMTALFQTFGVTPADFVVFDRPVRFRQIIIPAPCFEETSYAHLAFARMFRTMQATLLAGVDLAHSDTPVYLARFGLTSGVMGLLGEEEFAGELAARGVDIVHPERLSFQDQVRLFTERRNISGFAGSAFHNAAFAPPRRLMSLHLLEQPLSNQTLIDRACGHDALYLSSPDCLEVCAPPPGFAGGRRMIDPKRTANEFLRLLDPFMRAKPRTLPEEQSAYGAADSQPIGGVPRPNLALGRPARQSSTSIRSLGLSAEADAAGAVCGFCTGGHQFCTEWEDRPWWQVDLGPGAQVAEVKLFNTLGEDADLASSFVLLASDDGEHWREVARRSGGAPFGGLDGNPYVWRPPATLVTRFIRVALTTWAQLHLDQVVIYGPGDSAAQHPAAGGDAPAEPLAGASPTPDRPTLDAPTPDAPTPDAPTLDVPTLIQHFCEEQLAPWRGAMFSYAHLERSLLAATQQLPNAFIFDIAGGRVSFRIPPHMQALLDQGHALEVVRRAEIYRTLIAEAVAAWPPRPPVILAIELSDEAPQFAATPIFTFQKRAGELNLLLPDFEIVSLGYLEGVPHDTLAYASKAARAAFAGSTTGMTITPEALARDAVPRIRAARFFKNTPEVDFRLPNIVQTSTDEVAEALRREGYGVGRMDWPESYQYKFLISIDGNGAPCSRPAIILRSNSALIKYQSDHVLYYSSGLQAGRHYIPVTADEEVVTIVQREQERPGTFEAVARMGQDFAAAILTRAAILSYTERLLTGYASLVL